MANDDRLVALETALSSSRRRWDDDPAERANDWIRQPGNDAKIIADLESTADAGARFPHVWDRFGSSHSPSSASAQNRQDLPAEASRVLVLLDALPQVTLLESVEGIATWLYNWSRQVAAAANGLELWLKIWPLAVEVTNASQPTDEEAILDTVAPSSDNEPMDLDTLNSPAGKVLSVFLSACPKIEGTENPFDDPRLRTMRDASIAATGRSGLIVRHRMIEDLPYFLRADSAWTQEHLLAPLLETGADALALWRAIGRRTQFFDVLKTIGIPMSERVLDLRLGRETRESLGFSLVIECLHALKESRAPAVPYSRVQQVLRSLDPEVRAHCASGVDRFAREGSAGNISTSAPTPESLFHAAAEPFLERVWPQESSLVTPGVSSSFAQLPAASRQAFAAAVAAIDRFLVPFDCWSLFEYGLYDSADGTANLAFVDDETKAEALLQLLDRTVGTSEGAVVPHDLSDALERVRIVAAPLTNTSVFRRLAAAARRSK